jgi:hypothetical protein
LLEISIALLSPNGSNRKCVNHTDGQAEGSSADGRTCKMHVWLLLLQSGVLNIFNVILSEIKTINLDILNSRGECFN